MDSPTPMRGERGVRGMGQRPALVQHHHVRHGERRGEEQRDVRLRDAVAVHRRRLAPLLDVELQQPPGRDACRPALPPEAGGSTLGQVGERGETKPHFFCIFGIFCAFLRFSVFLCVYFLLFLLAIRLTNFLHGTTRGAEKNLPPKNRPDLPFQALLRQKKRCQKNAIKFRRTAEICPFSGGVPGVPPGSSLRLALGGG